MNLKKAFLLSSVLSMALYAADAPAAKADAPAAKADAPAAKVEDKLLPWITMEQAFAKSLTKRAQLANYIANESAKMKDIKDEAQKKAMEEQLQKAYASLNTLNLYMDTIFGIDNRREYEYNPVTSTIYLKVGNVRDAFLRAVQKRGLIANKLKELNDAKTAEKDQAKIDAIDKELAQFTKAYALLANALYEVYQIHPSRNYEFDAEKNLLLLKTNDEEVKKLQAEIDAQKKAATKK